MKSISIKNYVVTEGMTTTDISQTVPDQSLTIRQILENYTRGLPLGVNVKQPTWDDEFPDVEDLDLVELQELQEEYEETIQEYIKQRDYISRRFEQMDTPFNGEDIEPEGDKPTSPEP